MQFSLWNFKTWFNHKNIDLTYSITHNNATISKLKTSYTGQTDSNVAAIIPGHSYLVTDTCSAVIINRGDTITFPIANHNLIYNECLNMIEFYNQWEYQLAEFIVEGKELEDLIEASSVVFPFSLVIIDSRRKKIIFASEHLPKNYEACINQKFQTAQRKTNKTDSINTGFYSFNDTTTILSSMISVENNISYEIFVFEHTIKLQPGDIHILTALSKMIQTFLQFNKKSYFFQYHLDWYLKSVLETKKLVKEDLTFSLQSKDWNLEDKFVIFCIETSVKSNLPELESLLNTLKENIRFSCVFILNESIYLITNMTKYKSINALISQITLLISNKEFIGGMSFVFQGMDNLIHFCNQSHNCLEYARKGGTTLVFAKDIMLNLFSESVKKDDWLQSLVHPDLYKLIEYDKKNQTLLASTLYSYIIFAGNSKATADALNIHRNTLKYRLDEISDIISIDITKAEECQKLLISFLLISNKFL